MMTERMKAVLERTEKTLYQDGGRIKDHMTLDGIKDALKSVRCLMELMSGNGESTAVKAAAKTVPGMV